MSPLKIDKNVVSTGKKYPKLDLDEYRLSSRARFSLSAIRPDDVQGWDKAAAKARLQENLVALDELQERLYAEGEQALLIVFQAMDAAGKDSTIEAVTNFKAPSTLERAHDFLWRVHMHAPPKGMIGIFNRSHYEDVLIAKVKELAPATLIEKRYAHINHFEQLLVDHGTRILKVMLHISPEYQLEQFRDRLKTPSKHWKFNPDDLKERVFWNDYMEAYEEVLRRCSKKYAPWYVVPAEHKWFRTMVVSELFRNVLEGMDPRYPAPVFDPDLFDPNSLV